MTKGGGVVTNTERPPEWKKWSEHPDLFCDGDEYLVALRVTNADQETWWEYYSLGVSCDSENPVSFYHRENGESFDVCDPDNFEFYIKIEMLK